MRPQEGEPFQVDLPKGWRPLAPRRGTVGTGAAQFENAAGDRLRLAFESHPPPEIRAVAFELARPIHSSNPRLARDGRPFAVGVWRGGASVETRTFRDRRRASAWSVFILLTDGEGLKTFFLHLAHGPTWDEAASRAALASLGPL